MFLLRTFAPWLLLAFLGQQVSLSSGARNRSRGADKTVTQAPSRVQRGGNKPAATGRGKFSISEQIHCTWGARDVGDTVRLSVKCVQGGVTDIRCDYNAKPQSCPGYLSDNKGFWKQVGRAFKKLKDKVCSDDRALVRTGMCKRAPRDAHFKLDMPSSVSSGQSGEPQTPRPLPPLPPSTAAAPSACTGRANHRRKSEEHCGSWASVCAFFFSMLQSDDC
ncbi:fibroblast growth factor-binding protein 1-like [Pempheris klunzingeri]|uniref:fibroblast growth factor-binding protein 1-like n=1 Tax=Pempheris klunzingeri TaxID=3127111 RepID=UPI003980C4FB